MPHIHRAYDFVVSVFIVRRFGKAEEGAGPSRRNASGRYKVLLIHHKKYLEWLPIGGHIELWEDPSQALRREIAEECGLTVRLLSSAPNIKHSGVKPIETPEYVDVHRITNKHKHIAFVYFGLTRSKHVVLHTREHSEFRWVSAKELNDPQLRLTRSIRFYCRQALKKAARR